MCHKVSVLAQLWSKFKNSRSLGESWETWVPVGVDSSKSDALVAYNKSSQMTWEKFYGHWHPAPGKKSCGRPWPGNKSFSVIFVSAMFKFITGNQSFNFFCCCYHNIQVMFCIVSILILHDVYCLLCVTALVKGRILRSSVWSLLHYILFIAW